MRPHGEDELSGAVRAALIALYGIDDVVLRRVHAGTATDNFIAVGQSDKTPAAFVKVYRDHTVLSQDEAAIELAMFARDGGVPVPSLRLTHAGDTIGRGAGVALSVWEHIDGETAEGGLSGRRWDAVGAAVGTLHRRLATHPAAAPSQTLATSLVDVPAAIERHERLVAAYRRHGVDTDYAAWALDAAHERLRVLPRVAGLLERLPALTTQVVHGDLSAMNFMLRDDAVAAIVDFQPPTARSSAWELARIGCDPRTLVTHPDWPTSLPRLLSAYRDAHPAARQDDLDATIAIGCAGMLASTYPLAEPLERPRELDLPLQAYGRARHRAALMMLETTGA